MKWAVSLVFAYGHFNIPLECEYIWIDILTYDPGGWMDERVFRPLFCTIKAELGRGQPGLMR